MVVLRAVGCRVVLKYVADNIIASYSIMGWIRIGTPSKEQSQAGCLLAIIIIVVSIVVIVYNESTYRRIRSIHNVDLRLTIYGFTIYDFKLQNYNIFMK